MMSIAVFLLIYSIVTFNFRDQLLIIVAERIQRDPRAEYGRIFNFLGARYGVDSQSDVSVLA